jgi:hypothetical protein
MSRCQASNISDVCNVCQPNIVNAGTSQPFKHVTRLTQKRSLQALVDISDGGASLEETNHPVAVELAGISLLVALISALLPMTCWRVLYAQYISYSPSTEILHHPTTRPSTRQLSLRIRTSSAQIQSGGVSLSHISESTLEVEILRHQKHHRQCDYSLEAGAPE